MNGLRARIKSFQSQDRCKARRCLHAHGTPTYYHPLQRAPQAHIQQVAGESGLGKTTFINTLFSTTIKQYAEHRKRHQKQVDKTVEIEITKAELEEKFFKGQA